MTSEIIEKENPTPQRLLISTIALKVELTKTQITNQKGAERSKGFSPE